MSQALPLFLLLTAVVVYADLNHPVAIDRPPRPRQAATATDDAEKAQIEARVRAAREDREKRERVRKLARKAR